jgi:hypothetical protein
MVTDLEKNGGDVVGNSNNYVIRDLIEKTKNWLVQQMGKKFPSLSADPPPPPVVGRRGRGKKVRSSSSAVVAAADTSSSSSPPPSPPQ